MNTEVSRDPNFQDVLRGIGKIAFPLLDHKMESDRRDKHERWTPHKHMVLTTLAIFVDMGFNSWMVILALSGNGLGAGAVKLAHIIGSQALPEPITKIKNKIIDKKILLRFPPFPI
jgi:hypothetical protein